jgi:beta-glucosidase
MSRDINSIVSQMTLEEKAGLCSGLDSWHTKPVERLGIPSIMMTDGPHGLRKQSEETDHLGINQSVPATCFPSGAGLASSWHRELIKEVGEALAEECLAEGVSIILGPAANIKRSPLCGRNFEYLSEDPYLSSQIAASHIKGVQSKGVGTSLKHFAANNQEHRRMSVDAVIDERTLREIYLASFETAVKEAKPWTVMCAYNKVNGTYCSQNEYLLTEILRKDWGFDNFVVSDWGAVDERVKGLVAGLDLEMPSSNGINDKKIIEAVKNGKISEEVLDRTVKRLLKIIFRAVGNKKEGATYDRHVHHELAKKVAEQCMVLLKNDDNILPLKPEGIIAVIGAFAKQPRYQGGGSSHVNPTELDIPYEKIKETAKNAQVFYADGYRHDTDDMDASLIEEAKGVAAKADVAIIFAGFPERYESEGYDRPHMRMPDNHNELIKAVSEVQPNTVVVLSNGAPVEMPWLCSIKGLIEAYLGGQAFGGAIADVLFGHANPSGKLAETIPQKLSDNPSYLNFPGEGDRVEYREGLFVGYRYYDAKELEPLFPFGYGLSYTDFEYSGITVDKKEIDDTDTLTVKAKIKNTGSIAGKEIVQLYVKDVEKSVIRPEKELKGFCKIELAPGEEKEVEFELDKRAFAYYNTYIKDWYVESGDFEILIGKSSRDIVLKETVKVNSTTRIKKYYHRNSLLGDIMADPRGAEVIKEITAQFAVPIEGDEVDRDMMEAVARHMPLRALVTFLGGKLDEDMLDMFIKRLNENN